MKPAPLSGMLPLPAEGFVYSAPSPASRSMTGRRFFRVLSVEGHGEDRSASAVEISDRGRPLPVDPENPHRSLPFNVKLSAEGRMPSCYRLEEGNPMSSNPITAADVAAMPKKSATPKPKKPVGAEKAKALVHKYVKEAVKEIAASAPKPTVPLLQRLPASDLPGNIKSYEPLKRSAAYKALKEGALPVAYFGHWLLLWTAKEGFSTTLDADYHFEGQVEHRAARTGKRHEAERTAALNTMKKAPAPPAAEKPEPKKAEPIKPLLKPKAAKKAAAQHAPKAKARKRTVKA